MFTSGEQVASKRLSCLPWGAPGGPTKGGLIDDTLKGGLAKRRTVGHLELCLLPKAFTLGRFLAAIENSVAMGCCLVSLLIGALGALGQRKLKRLFAYGAIAHVGYLLMGVCCATAEGSMWLFFYVALYALQSLIAFALLMCPARREWVLSFQGACYLSELHTLMKTNRVLAASFAITLFSAAGIPPLAGFVGKYFILFSAFNTQLYLLAGTGALLTVISCVAPRAAQFAPTVRIQ